jgi:hypothetical protein
MNDLNLNDVVAYQPVTRKELLELLEQLEKAQKRVDELERKFNPRCCPQKESDAWHQAIPDTVAAFRSLLEVNE